MRVIKFRGITYQENKWAYGSLLLHEEKQPIISYYDSDADERNWLLVIPETAGQFTGCYDATRWEELTSAEQAAYLASNKDNTPETWKGKEIYEGDIVKFRDCPPGVVKYGDKGNFGIQWSDIIPSRGFLRDMDKEFISECKIIGNIHDNPELLTKEVQ